MSLIVRNVKAEDAGIYTIKAQNDLGEDSAQITLNVKCPPKIIKPDNMTSLASESYKMSIEIKGNPEPKAKFYKNGQEIIENDRIKFLTADSFHLIKFSKTELSDSGTYSVIATNEISQASEFWQFTVSSPPTLIKSLEEEIIVEEREDIELIIKVNIS